MDLPSPHPIAVTQFRGHSRGQKHIHRIYVLTLAIATEGAWQIGGCELPVGQRFITLSIPGDHEHGALVGDNHGWWVQFDWPGTEISRMSAAEYQLATGDWTQRVPRCKIVTAQEVTDFVTLYRLLDDACQAPALSGQLLAAGLLQQLLAGFLKLPEQPRQLAGHRALVAFVERLHETAFQPIRLRDICQGMGITFGHVRELFVAQYGISPVEYRTRLRTERARQLLLSTTLNVSEVASQCGYLDPLYFSRVFKQRFGLSPRRLIAEFGLDLLEKG